MSLDSLDKLIEQILKEREYVSGSRMPTRPAREQPDFQNPMIHRVTSHQGLVSGLKKMSQLCSFVSLRGRQKYLEESFSAKFKRMIAAEMMHKFLTTTITDTGVLGYDSRQAGFAMEKMLASFLGGQVIDPNMKGARYTNIADVKFGSLSYSIKFYSRNSIKNYGFGQKFSTIYGWWSQNKESNQPLRYLIFVKDSEGDKVGFTVFHAIIPKQQIAKIVLDRIGDEGGFYDLIVDKFKEENPEIFDNIVQNIMARKNIQFEPDDLEILKALENDNEFKKFYASEIYNIKDDLKLYKGDMPTVQTPPGNKPKTDQVPQEDDNFIDLSFNSFQAIASLMMPVSIDDFLSQSFKEVGQDVEMLYTSLDNFKDSLEEHYLSNKEDNTNVIDNYESLENSFKNAFLAKKEEIT